MLNVTVSFPESTDAPASGLKVRRYELREAMSELFELTVEILSTDPSITESSVVGQPVQVSFADEPFLKELKGVVRQMEQRTAVLDGDSLYVWTIVPPLWLTTRRRDHRIFQDLRAPEIVEAVLADPSYSGRIQAPVKTLAGDFPKREYVVQYDETDWAFISRILAYAGIASYFDHGSGSVWTLIDDTSALAPDGATSAIRFTDQTQQGALDASDATPHVLTAVVRSGIETSAVTIRDFDFEKPAFKLEAKKDAAETFTNEAPLEAYTYEVGKFTDQAAGDTRAERFLEAERAPRRRILCTTSFAAQPGVRMTIEDHPRADLAGELLVVRARTVMEADERGSHELELMDLANRFRPVRRAKPRISGTQTAFVMAANGDEIDVDKYGRVLIELHWDRRDKHTGVTSRRVRVANGWAGDGYGFVMLPRRGDEVVVAYLDGDPDEPLIVGRVHNAVFATPLKLPEEKAISVWRSRSTPGGQGYNEILMDDAAGAERLAMHAQRDFKQVVERDAVTEVGRHETRTVKGNRTLHVVGDQVEQVDGDKWIQATGALNMHGKTVAMSSDQKMEIWSGDYMNIHCSSNRDDETTGNHAIKADAVFINGDSGVQVRAPKVHIFGGSEIHLGVGNSTIHITDGGIKITSAGDVEVNGAVVKLNC